MGAAAPPGVGPLVTVVARCGRCSTTPSPESSPCVRARPRVTPCRVHLRQRHPTTSLKPLWLRLSSRLWDPCIDTLVPAVRSVGPGVPCHCLQHHSDNTTPSDWVVDSDASYHTTSSAGSLSRSHLPHPSNPSIIGGNGSTLSVTSVGVSILPGPFYLNDVLVPPHITHNLLFVRRFTIHVPLNLTHLVSL